MKVHAWVFLCFHNPPNSDIDYRIFNVRTWSFLLRVHGGWACTPTSQDNIFDWKTLTNLYCAPDAGVVRTSGLCIASPTLYQLSHPVTPIIIIMIIIIIIIIMKNFNRHNYHSHHGSKRRELAQHAHALTRIARIQSYTYINTRCAKRQLSYYRIWNRFFYILKVPDVWFFRFMGHSWYSSESVEKILGVYMCECFIFQTVWSLQNRRKWVFL